LIPALVIQLPEKTASDVPRAEVNRLLLHDCSFYG
jgi:hypothetical protein